MGGLRAAARSKQCVSNKKVGRRKGGRWKFRKYIETSLISASPSPPRIRFYRHRDFRLTVNTVERLVDVSDSFIEEFKGEETMVEKADSYSFLSLTLSLSLSVLRFVFARNRPRERLEREETKKLGRCWSTRKGYGYRRYELFNCLSWLDLKRKILSEDFVSCKPRRGVYIRPASRFNVQCTQFEPVQFSWLEKHGCSWSIY